MSTMYKVYCGGILRYHGEDVDAASAIWAELPVEATMWMVPDQRWGVPVRLA